MTNELINDKLAAITAAKRLRPLAHLKAIIDSTPAPNAMLRWLKLDDTALDHPDFIELGCDEHDKLPIATTLKSPGIVVTHSVTDTAELHDSLLLDSCKTRKIPVLLRDEFVDEYQVYLSRALGFSGMVIPMQPIDLALAQYFVEIGRDLGLETCLQCDNDIQLTTALQTDAAIVIINPASDYARQKLLQVAREHQDLLPRTWLERRRITTTLDNQPQTIHIYSRCGL